MGELNNVGAYGERLAAHYHMTDAPFAVLGSVKTRQMAITRLASRKGLLTPTAPIPPEKALVFVYRMQPALQYKLWVDGRSVATQPIPAGGLNVADLEGNPIVWPQSAFDSVQYHVPRTTLDRFADEAGMPRVGSPECTAVTLDPVFQHLTELVLPSLDHPKDFSQLFMDQFVDMFCAHVIYRQSGLHSPTVHRGGLSASQKRRAAELLISNLDGSISLADAAAECGLSVSHFARSFRVSFGMPVHRWVITQRISKAKALLLNERAPLIEIALRAGFADQAAFNRSFAKAVGTSPGRWRNANRRW